MSKVALLVTKAASVQGAMALAGKAGSVLSSILLARLLYPEDFGLQTIAVMVMGLANMFSNFGFQTYIIQAKVLNSERLNTCFTLNILFSAVFGLLVGCVGFTSATVPPMFREMLLLYGAMIFISGLSYSQLAVLKRELQFRESSRAELAFSLTSNGGRVAFAFAGFGALCFPLGDLLGALARWLLVLQVRSNSLRLCLPSSEVLREVLRFGTYTTSVGFASFLASQIDKALLTVSQSIASIGLYGFAATMAAMFYNAAIVPQSSVFLAAFARLQEDIEGARNFLTKSSRFIFSLALPINVLWLLEAENIVTVVFGERWLEAALLIRILVIDYFVRSMFSGITSLQLSFGLAREAARTKWINSAIFVIFMLIAWGLEMSIEGYATMYVAASLLSHAHNVHVNGKLVQLQLLPFLANLVIPAAIAVASTAMWWAAQSGTPGQPEVLDLIAAVSAWLTTYILLTLFFNRIVVDKLRLMILRKVAMT